MKIIDKVEFNETYFKKNFNYKDLCNVWFPNIFVGSGINHAFESNLIHLCLFCVAFDQSVPEQTSDYIDDQYYEIVERLDSNDPKIREFVIKLLEKEFDGTLLPYLSDNFSLIYSFEMNMLRTQLIYSKFNQSYYYLKTTLYFDVKKNQLTDNINSFQVPKIFKSKIKPSQRDFFEKILEDEKNLYTKEEFEILKKDKVYVDEKGQNLLQLYLNNEGIMKK